ncbi:MAG TPA: lacto-N-biose phosphorylase central domain-containing protein, partial [Armatimonadota bacterium]|nr:lacto-N-biose phosphorylase central domain-containing protein [Armatimonadota bacterium]
MRSLVVMLLAACATAAPASEAWFLPYEPDDSTVVLFHLDGEGDEEPSAGDPATQVKLMAGATRGEGVFAGDAELHGAKECLRVVGEQTLRLANDQPFTAEMWLRPDSAEGAVFSLGTRFYLRASFSQGTAVFGYRAASFPIRWFPVSGIPWRRRQWQHVALVHDADRQVSIYLDGRLVAQTAHQDEGDYAEGGGGVFGAHDGWQNFMVGGLDEIRVSNAARSFEPLLAQSAWLPGEQVRLNLDDVQLPERVATVRVTANAADRSEVFAGELPVGEASRPLFDASALGDGPGRVTVAFLDAGGAVIGSVSQPASYVGAQVAELGARAQECRRTIAAAEATLPQAHVAELMLAASEAAAERRSIDLALDYMSAAEYAAGTLASGEAAYRAAVRKLVRSGERDDRLRVTMSWDADQGAADALAWADRVGANELVSTSRSTTREGLQLWRDAGYHTAMLGPVPMHTAERDTPDQCQFGYWYMDSAPAQGETVEVKLVAPDWGGLAVSTFLPPAEHWLVLDTATGEQLAPDRWEYDPKLARLTITGAAAGHVYRVYYVIQSGGIGDPLYEPFAQHGLQVLDELVAPFEGVLETYWYDDLAYVWPGGNPQGGSDWESYTCAARPENREAFTTATGIEFDPRWLVMAPRTLDVPPRPEYFAWMAWVQGGVNQWMERATEVCRKHGIRTWLYWGDAHVGIEPFLGALQAGRVDEVDKPAADPVTARALVDFPGDAYRRLRVDWLHDRIVGRPDAAQGLVAKWDRCRRGLLMAPPSGIYWMPMPSVTMQPDEAVREGGAEAIAAISDDFRLIGRHLAGQRAWEGGLNLYVVHSWGKQYSWRPWGSPVLWHLTDLPVRVRFISFRDVIAGGVPDDADCLLLYGLPDTAWSGGYVWEDPKLAEAITGFVQAGGGLVALQAPSQVEDPDPRWALANLLGVTGEGAVGQAPAEVAISGDEWVDTEALAAAREQEGTSLVAAAGLTWPGPPAPTSVPRMTATVGVKVTAADATVAYALQAGEGRWTPGVVLRQAGEGRCAYLCGYSPDYAFSRLLRSAMFWAAQAEERAAWLDVTGGDNLFAYAYPQARMIALLSGADQPVQATVRCSPQVLGPDVAGASPVVDVVT